MNDDSLLTLFMAIAFVIVFVLVYIVPVAGVVTGSILLMKKPEKKALGLTILLLSIAVCIVVAIWKINDVMRSH